VYGTQNRGVRESDSNIDSQRNAAREREGGRERERERERKGCERDRRKRKNGLLRRIVSLNLFSYCKYFDFCVSSTVCVYACIG